MIASDSKALGNCSAIVINKGNCDIGGSCVYVRAERYSVVDTLSKCVAVTVFYDEAGRNSTDVSIEIYQDGSIKDVCLGTNG